MIRVPEYGLRDLVMSEVEGPSTLGYPGLICQVEGSRNVLKEESLGNDSDQEEGIIDFMHDCGGGMLLSD